MPCEEIWTQCLCMIMHADEYGSRLELWDSVECKDKNNHRLDVNVVGFVNKTHHKLYSTRFVQLTLRKKPMAKPGWYRQVF